MDRMKKQMQRIRNYLHSIDQEGYEVSGDAIEIGLIDWSVTEKSRGASNRNSNSIMKK